nr:MBL fold metallo-hydrolase [uncultured Undibacterium sp.]
MNMFYSFSYFIGRATPWCFLLLHLAPVHAQAPTRFTAFERSITGHRYSQEQAHDPADSFLPVPATESFLLAANGQYRGRSYLTYPGKIVFQELTIGSLAGTKTIDELKWREGVAITAGDAAAAQEELADSLFLSPQLIASTTTDLAGRPLRIERDGNGRVASLHVADQSFKYADYRCMQGMCQPYVIEMRRGEILAAKWTVTEFRLHPAIDASMFKLPNGYVAAAPSGPLRLSKLDKNVFRIDGAASGYHTGVVKGERGIAVFDPSVSVAEATLNRKLIESQFPGIPITHVILSHAHGDHLRGLPAYLGEGVSVIAGDRASTSLQRQFGEAVRSVHEVKQSYRLDLGGIEVQILPVKSTHAATMLIAHVAKQKLVFQGDLFYIPEQGQVPAPFEGAGELWQAIRSNGLAVATIVGVHGRSGTLGELREALRKTGKPIKPVSK